MKKFPILVILRILLGGLFVMSGYTKLIEPYQNFLLAVHSYEVVTGFPAFLVAIILPWFEFIIGVFFILGLWFSFSLSILWAMCVLFIGVVAQALIRGLNITECGCFGEGKSLPPSQVLMIDIAIFFVFGAMWKFKNHAKVFSLDQYFDNLVLKGKNVGKKGKRV